MIEESLYLLRDNVECSLVLFLIIACYWISGPAQTLLARALLAGAECENRV